MADVWLKERLVRADMASTPDVRGAREIVQAVKRRRATQRGVRAAASMAAVGVVAIISVVLSFSRSADRNAPVADAARPAIPENLNGTHGQDARVTGSV